jgi:hypothetical protein
MWAIDELGAVIKTGARSALIFGCGIADFPAARHSEKAKFRPSTLPNN